MRKPNSPKFLEVTIGDIGQGIAKTLKQNPKYSDFSDIDALLIAFKSNVSSYPDEARRGKGLNDLLAIASGNSAWLRIDSCGNSILFDFQNQKKLVDRRVSAEIIGTRISLILIDSTFNTVRKENLGRMIDTEMGLKK